MVMDLDRQIACVAREIMMREAVYPRYVDAKKLKPEKAAYEIRCMTAVLATLEGLRKPWDGVERRRTMPDGDTTLPLPEDVLTTTSLPTAATATG
jgi:hypothetical protein